MDKKLVDIIEETRKSHAIIREQTVQRQKRIVQAVLSRLDEAILKKGEIPGDVEMLLDEESYIACCANCSVSGMKYWPLVQLFHLKHTLIRIAHCSVALRQLPSVPADGFWNRLLGRTKPGEEVRCVWFRIVPVSESPASV